MNSYAERLTTIHSTGAPVDQWSHMPAVISSALVSAQGSSGYRGCQIRASAPPRLKNP